MPRVTVEGRPTFEVPEDKKLILAMEDAGIDVLHRCGGNIRCTSCRVELLAGEVGPQSEAERAKLTEKGHDPDRVRLSCQIRVHGDLTVRPVMTLASSGLGDPGPRPVD